MEQELRKYFNSIMKTTATLEDIKNSINIITNGTYKFRVLYTANNKTPYDVIRYDRLDLSVKIENGIVINIIQRYYELP